MRYLAESGHIILDITIESGTDLDSRFKAWCNDENEYIIINGWMFTFSEV